MRRGYGWTVVDPGNNLVSVLASLRPQTALAKSGQSNESLAGGQEALEILQKGTGLAGSVSRAKDPGLHGSDYCAEWPCAAKKRFAGKRFGYFGTPK